MTSSAALSLLLFKIKEVVSQVARPTVTNPNPNKAILIAGIAFFFIKSLYYFKL
jgi:hypothetical protein